MSDKILEASKSVTSAVKLIRDWTPDDYAISLIVNSWDFGGRTSKIVRTTYNVFIGSNVKGSIVHEMDVNSIHTALLFAYAATRQFETKEKTNG